MQGILKICLSNYLCIDYICFLGNCTVIKGAVESNKFANLRKAALSNEQNSVITCIADYCFYSVLIKCKIAITANHVEFLPVFQSNF